MMTNFEIYDNGSLTRNTLTLGACSCVFSDSRKSEQKLTGSLKQIKFGKTLFQPIFVDDHGRTMPIQKNLARLFPMLLQKNGAIDATVGEQIFKYYQQCKQQITATA